MLVYQGAAAFQMWTEQPAPVDVMRKACQEFIQRTADTAHLADERTWTQV
jgi:hypothetical protein